MSSLWTPSGEHRVPSPEPEDASKPPGPGQPGSGGSGGGPRPGSGRPEGPPAGAGTGASAADRAELEAQMEEVRRQLVEAPAEAVVANHAYGLFELAALHLSQPEPDLDAARLAIDGMAALLEGLAGRLGESEPEIHAGLAQIRLAFVQVQAAASGGAGR